MAVFIK